MIVNGVYGLGSQSAIVALPHGEGFWYAVEGSINCNYTHQTLEDGVNVESLIDTNFFTATRPIMDEDDLQREIDEQLDRANNLMI